MKTTVTLTMNPTLDIGLGIDRLVPNQKLRADGVRREPGGGGINVARGIHRLDGKVCALFMGDSALGPRLASLLDDEGVPCRRLPVTGSLREGFSVRVEETDELFHFVLPGPELSAKEAQQALDAALSFEPAPDYLVASGGLPPGVGDDFYARLARGAARKGIRFALDTHGEPLRAAVDEGVYLIKPNIREFAEISGEETSDEHIICEQAREVVHRYDVKVLIVTLGDQGALLTTRDTQLRFRPPKTRVVSPVGAGDSFLAVCIHRLASDGSLREALRGGVAGAAAAVMTPGTSLFDPDEFRQVLAQTEELPVGDEKT